MRFLIAASVGMVLSGCGQFAEDPNARAARVNAWMANQRAMDANTPQAYQMPVNRPTNCVSNINGQQVNTTCDR
jgi:hypothetical protein